jgi:hypothetical protein
LPTNRHPLAMGVTLRLTWHPELEQLVMSVR